jgi:hypothetical protein
MDRMESQLPVAGIPEIYGFTWGEICGEGVPAIQRAGTYPVTDFDRFQYSDAKSFSEPEGHVPFPRYL